MGNSGSVLTEDDLNEMKRCSGLPSQTIQSLYRRFLRLDADNSGTLSFSELLSIPELAMNPLVPRILAVLDSSHSKEVNFREFIQAIKVLTPHA
jgi:serine/threonine-protein phosphatase 2B regulatory subunit